MKFAATPASRSLWDAVTRMPRRPNEPANGGWYESSLELRQGLEVQETSLASLPADTVRALLMRRAAGQAAG